MGAYTKVSQGKRVWRQYVPEVKPTTRGLSTVPKAQDPLVGQGAGPPQTLLLQMGPPWRDWWVRGVRETRGGGAVYLREARG